MPYTSIGTCKTFYTTKGRARLQTAALVTHAAEVFICDFSDYSRLHTVVYQEIIAGRGHRIEDAADAVRLAERVCETAGRALPAAP